MINLNVAIKLFNDIWILFNSKVSVKSLDYSRGALGRAQFENRCATVLKHFNTFSMVFVRRTTYVSLN
jgi:hypothetical protein